MKNVSIEVLRKVYTDLKVEYPLEDFISALETESRAAQEEKDKSEEKKRLAKIEEAKKIYVEHVFDVVPEEHKDCVEDYIDEIVSEMDLWEAFYDEDGMDDEGETITEFLLVGDKLYLVDIHCEAQWVGDWSVRKNLPGDISVESVKEVEGFDIIERTADGVRVKLHHLVTNS